MSRNFEQTDRPSKPEQKPVDNSAKIRKLGELAIKGASKDKGKK